MSVVPITPAEVFSRGVLPDKVCDVINQLLLEKYDYKEASIYIKEMDVLELSIKKMMSDNDDKCKNFFKNPNWWFNVCFAYRLAGWDVRRQDHGRKSSCLIFTRVKTGRFLVGD